MSGVSLSMVSIHLKRQHLFLNVLLEPWCLAATLLEKSGWCSLASNDKFGSLERLRKLCEMGQLHEALKVVDLVDKQISHISIRMYHCLLQACINDKDLIAGRKVYSLIRIDGFESNTFLGSYLVRMFDLCGSLLEAKEVFSHLADPNVFTWGAMISAYAKHGQGDQAIQLYLNMQGSNVKADGHILVAVLKACTNTSALSQGILIHTQVLESSNNLNVFIGNALIDMYAKCGKLDKARRVFDNWPRQDIVSWNTMIAGYTLNGQAQEALKLSLHLQSNSKKLDTVTFVSLLKACCNIAALREGKLAHIHIIENSFELNEFVGSTLIDMYAKCGCLDDACSVFDKLPKHDVVTWNAMITAYGQHDGYEDGHKALELFWKMQQESKQPDNVTFISILKVCSNIAARAQGQYIHACMVESGFATDVSVGNALISMYASCGRIKDACKLFHDLPRQDVVTWNSMIAGYAEHGLDHDALQLFQQMRKEGKKTDNVTWNTVIALCADYGHHQEALRFFHLMQQEGKKPDNFTFVSILKSCASIAALDQGRLFHLHIIESEVVSDIFVTNTLIHMYSKCGSLKEAREIFDRSPKQCVVTWNAVIAAYAQHGHNHEALQLFQQMELEESKPDNATWNAIIAGYVQYGHGIEALQFFDNMLFQGVQPDSATFVSMVKACSIMGGLCEGKLIHALIMASGFEVDVTVGNSLIDMYAKCGSLQEACNVFKMLPEKSLVTWNSIIAGYALHNDYKLSLQHFEDMQKKGLQPDETTFASLFAACSHMGLVDEGCQWLKTMRATHGIMPGLEHYNCLVDLLGRAGHVAVAQDLLKTTPFCSNIVGWMSLLSNCKTYGNVELGRQCFHHVVKINAMYGSGYVLMSNIYAAAEFWEDADKVQAQRKTTIAWKKPGEAFIEVDNKLYGFVVGDKQHPLCTAIYTKLNRIHQHFKEEGQIPCLDYLVPMADEDTQYSVYGIVLNL